VSDLMFGQLDVLGRKWVDLRCNLGSNSRIRHDGGFCSDWIQKAKINEG